MEKITKLWQIAFLVLVMFKYCSSEETFCSINGKKALQKVSEKFLSITIDPAILLTGINLSDTSLLLAKNLAPAYIRLAGPSTQYVKFAQNGADSHPHFSENFANIFATPSIWFGVNEWFNLANLTPIFGINDSHKDGNGAWNAKEVMPLLELSDRLNFSCFWQLGFDCNGKTEKQYKDDLKLLRKSLDQFPDHNQTWKIVGSDISKCFSKDLLNDAELEGVVEGVMWEPISNNEDFRGLDMGKIEKQNNLHHSNSHINLWTTLPKSTKRITFATAIEWAKKIGDVAENGYQVVFREPRLHELSSDTPIYWFSFLHKKLMGTNVLDVKATPNPPETFIYAHCTKKQNSYVRRGAMTVLLVNGGNENFTASIRLSVLSSEKTMEIQSYVLTSENEESTITFLNNEQLSIDLLNADNFLKPRLRRAKTSSHVSLQVPPKSIGFFVLTNARIPVCIEQEEEINLILEEINVDQQLPLSKEINFDINSRGSFNKNYITLDMMRAKLLQELESDEKFYAEQSKKFKLNAVELPKITKEESRGHDGDNKKTKQLLLERPKLLKPQEIEKKLENIKQLIKERFKPVPKDAADALKSEKVLPTVDDEPMKNGVELTSEELKSILRRRAKAIAIKRRIKLNSLELDELLDKTVKKNSRKINKRDINTILLEERWKLCNCKHDSEEIHDAFKENNWKSVNANFKRSISDDIKSLKQKIPRRLNSFLAEKKQQLHNVKYNLRQSLPDIMRRRPKRDINMDLLKRKSETLPKKKTISKPLKIKLKDQEEKEATLRLPGQTSEELFKDLESSEEKVPEISLPKIPSEIYAELATEDSEDEYDGSFESEEPNAKPSPNNKKLVTNPLFNRKTAGNKAFADTRNRKSKKNKKTKEEIISSDEALQFLSPSAEFDDIEDDLPCIHEFFGEKIILPKNKLSVKKKPIFNELWEYKLPLKSNKADNKKNTMKELDDALFADEYETDDFEVRKKRDTEPVMKDDYMAYKKYMRNELKQLKQQMKTDKLRYAEEKQKNRLLLGKIKKNNLTDDKQVSDKTSNEDTFSYLQKLKLKLSKRKDLIATLLKNDEKLQEKLNKIKQSSNDTKEGINKLDHNRSPLPIVHVEKRSAQFEKDLFGNYKPLTPALKPWVPSDILSLKRYQFLTTPYIPQLFKPPNDNNILKNLHFKNQYLNFRKRRSLSKEIISVENDIDGFLNEIQKETEHYVKPKLDFQNGDYQLILPNKDKMEIKAEPGDTKFQFVHHNRNNRKDNHTKDNISSAVKSVRISNLGGNSTLRYRDENKVLSDDIVQNQALTSVENANQEGVTRKPKFARQRSFSKFAKQNVQKIPTREEQEIVKTFFDKVTDIFHEVGTRVASYFRHLVLS